MQLLFEKKKQQQQHIYVKEDNIGISFNDARIHPIW